MDATGIDLLRRWLANQRMTQAEFAARLRTYQPTVSQVMNGKRPPSWELAFRIEELTGIPAKLLRERRAA